MVPLAGTLAKTMNSARVSAFRTEINQNLTSGVWYPTLSDVGGGRGQRPGMSCHASLTSRDVCRAGGRRPFLSDVRVFFNRR